MYTNKTENLFFFTFIFYRNFRNRLQFTIYNLQFTIYNGCHLINQGQMSFAAHRPPATGNRQLATGN
jgi:hypothetical protein